MARLFRSKSCSLNLMPPPLYEDTDEDDEEKEVSENPATTPFLSSGDSDGIGRNQAQLSVLAVVAAALRKSLVTCSVDIEEHVDIGWPTDVRHVSHVTFDRFDGFLGLPVDLQPEVPRKPPSASASVFGVSAESMQCGYDRRGNSVPTILLRMQTRLYSQGGLQAEGIFRINAENSEEENVRKQLNSGVVPHEIDVHCLSGLIKAWFRELPSGVLDCLTPQQVMHCNTEEECSHLVKQLPPTECALLDWGINLMADVVHHQHHNKMNARNIAMVFAPNMTQMADPLTALIHAVQVMNLLKTLIIKTLRQREQQQEEESDALDQQVVAAKEQASGNSRAGKSSPVTRKRRTLEHSFKDEYESMEAEEGILNRLSLRRGMQKLCRHPVFQLAKKSGRSLC